MLWIPRLLVSSFIIMMVVPALAYSFSFDRSDIHSSWDTTISYGWIYRLQSSAPELIGTANGGTAFSVNGDDGNLNYSDTGIVSSTLKLNTEFEINYQNFGAFMRGIGFKDSQADSVSQDTNRTSLSADTIKLNGENILLLDAYVWGNFEFNQLPVSLQIGKQVLNWGESTFIQNGINVTNAVDVSKLRSPGAELKDALIPVGIISASFAVNDNVSLDVYWQYDYEHTLLEPVGTYFSSNDFVGENGSFVVLGFGSIADYIDLDTSLIPINTVPSIPGRLISGATVSATRNADLRPDQSNEYGIALRTYLTDLNDTEIGFYHIKYHSRLPLINAISATPVANNTPPFNNPITPASYFISYPEDISLYGLSFSTQLSNSDWVLQGEYSFRDGAPLQVDDIELLSAALHFELLDAQCTVAFGGSCASQLGVFGNGATIPGFIRRDISQLQMTATRIFSSIFNAEQAVLVSEFAITHVHNMPRESDLRLDAPGTNLPGNLTTVALLTAAGINSPIETNDFADATSWGYRLAGRLTYNNVIGGVNLSPYISWRQDVSGNTPGPGGNFIEGLKQITLGLRIDYQSKWEVNTSYTNFFGAGSQNLLQDRDFLVFNVSYAF